jgi:rod shape determining protein RodA
VIGAPDVAAPPSGARALWMRLRRADLPVIVLTAMLIAAGFAAIASAGGDRGPLLLLRQAEACALGVVVLLIIVLVPYQRLLKLAPPVYAILLAMLGLVLVIGPRINGAQRWLMFGSYSFQPSEPLKLVAILLLARLLRFGRELDGVGKWLPALLLTLVPVGLIMKQPDLGTSLVYVPVGVALIFVSGIPVRSLVALGLLGAAVAVIGFLFLLHPYQKERVRSTIFHDRLAPYEANREGFQLKQALAAVEGGGWSGHGLGDGAVTQSGRLPESHNDFIFAVVSEETGFLGAGAILLLYLLLVGAILRVGVRTREPAGRLVCVGVATLVTAQAGVHAGVSLGVVPTTGMPLPFISYGGSALLTFLIAIAFVLNVSCHPAGMLAGRSGVPASY